MHAKNKRKFLAMTAFEEFWDKKSDIIFLGEWCTLYNKKEVWSKYNENIIPYPFKNTNTFDKAYRYSNKIYNLVFPQIASNLNKMHNLKYSNQFWQIVIGPWLSHFIPVVYERYSNIKAALKLYPDLYTYVIDKEYRVTPYDTNSFFNLIQNDIFNLQIYSQIYEHLGKDYIAKSLSQPNPDRIDLYKERSKLETFIKYLIKSAGKYLTKITKVTCLYNSYFKNSLLKDFFVKSKFSVVPLFSPAFVFPDFQVDKNLRDKLDLKFHTKDEFLNLLHRIIPLSIPKIFIEGFYLRETIIKKLFPLKPDCIFSTNSWWFDELFKVWAADCRENGTKMLIVQHGGNYGSILAHQSEDYELSIADKYYTWGWDKQGSKKIKAMPAAKLLGNIRQKKEYSGILYVATGLPRYFKGFYSGAGIYFTEYLEWQKRFILALNDPMREKMRIRLYPVDYGWNVRERLEDLPQKIKFEEKGISFLESLNNVKLYICDHLSTTFLEALSCNIPTILFWDNKVERLRQDAVKYYKLLHDAGVLYYKPEDAANAVKLFYNDIELWWNEPKRIDVLTKFRNNFSRREDDELHLWLDEFRKVSQ